MEEKRIAVIDVCLKVCIKFIPATKENFALLNGHYKEVGTKMIHDDSHKCTDQLEEMLKKLPKNELDKVHKTDFCAVFHSEW